MNSTSTSWHSHLDETKRGLARLLARENLIVRHADVPTANFDLQSRTLTLPKWTNITVDQYDLLIGHEVGHALYSDDLDAVKTSHQFPGLHTYINVLEDVRIERRVKDEFPGLRGSFTRGYRDFFEKGPIFQLEKPVDQYDFIDRINIHYKIGAHVDVPFSDDERLILARLDKCRTMQEIVALARELWSGQKQQNEQKQQEQSGQMSGESQDSQGAQDQTAPVASDSNDQNDDQQDGAGNGDESDDQQDDEQNANGSGDESDDEQPSGNASGEQEPSAGEPTPSTDPVAETDQFNADALSQLDREQNDGKGVDHVLLAPLSDAVVKDCTVDNATFVRDAMSHLNSHPDRIKRATDYLTEFQSKFGPTVAHMAREFDRRKTAKLHERARTARTGRIDMTKLASYKFREDIFQQVTIIPNGKSHGIVLLIDGSGSMTNVFGDVIEQVMLFTQFAQRVNIPVQAFMFHDARTTAQIAALEQMPQYTARPSGVELVCLYDSTQKTHKSQQIALAAVASMWSGYYSPVRIAVPHISLGMTPLNGGLLLVERHVAKLKNTLRLEKMSLIVLTDGDATDSVTYNTSQNHRSYTQTAIYRDTVTRQVYNYTEEASSWNGQNCVRTLDNSDGMMLVDSIRRRHGARVVRIHIAAGRDTRRMHKDGNVGVWNLVQSSMLPTVRKQGTADSLSTDMVSKAAAELKDKGQTTFAGPLFYFDALIVVSSNTLDLDEDDFESKDTTGWSARKIASSFTKANVNAMKNRVFVNAVVPYLA